MSIQKWSSLTQAVRRVFFSTVRKKLPLDYPVKPPLVVVFVFAWDSTFIYPYKLTVFTTHTTYVLFPFVHRTVHSTLSHVVVTFISTAPSANHNVNHLLSVQHPCYTLKINFFLTPKHFTKRYNCTTRICWSSTSTIHTNFNYLVISLILNAQHLAFKNIPTWLIFIGNLSVPQQQ